jgi:predicted Zn-dependent peptidase
VKQTIFSHTLPNGLVLLAEPIAGVESAAFSLRVPAGCAYEPADRGGLAGLTCELTLRGCGTRSSREFVNDLDNLGVERGEGVSDAHTSFSGAMLSRNLLPALSIYVDLVRRPHLPDEELDPSRAVAMQELSAVEDEPAQKVMLELRRRQYPDPWGRPSQGDAAGLESATIDDVASFFDTCYRPNGAILGVAGSFDWPRLKDHVGRLFGDWEPVDVPDPVERSLGERRVHLHHESNQTQIGIAYDSIPYRDPDYFQAWGAVGVLSGGMSSRLFTEVREKRGLCYSVYATHSSLRDRGSVMCYAGTSAERAQETLDVTIGELRRLARGIEAGELDRLKARIKSSLIMQGESSGARASAISRDWYYLGRSRTLDEVGALIDAVTRDSINGFLADHPPGDFTIVTLGSQPLEVPVAVP